jgi:hypothetical protein
MHITTVIVFCQFLLQHEYRGVERCLMWWAYVVRVHPRQARQAAAQCHGLLTVHKTSQKGQNMQMQIFSPKIMFIMKWTLDFM